MNLPKINQDLLNQLRGLFFSKDNSIIIAKNQVIGIATQSRPSSNPPAPYLFIYPKADGNFYKLDSDGNEEQIGGGGGGESNTASNIGVGGVGTYAQKVGVDLQFRNINAGSAQITVVLDGGNNEVDIDIGEILLASLGGYTRGDIIRGGAADWEDYVAKTNHFILVGDGNDIVSKAFDWDDMSAGAGADMVHDHSGNAEGGQLDWDTVWSDAVHNHSNNAEGGTLPQDAVEVSKLVASDGAPDPALSADGSGYLSSAVQPLFSAYKSAQTNNVTGDSTTYTVICDTEIFDVGGNYNNATGVFTAPVTGKYLLCFSVLARGITSSHTGGQTFIVTSNRTYSATVKNPYNSAYGGTDVSFFDFCIADMDISDTAYGQIQVASGALVVDVYGTATNPRTYFQGYLLI